MDGIRTIPPRRKKHKSIQEESMHPVDFPIPCHVIESHDDALPFWHLAIRRKKLPFSKIQMVHIDAHPDLSIADDLKAETCFQPSDLYQKLSTSVGGIAEWILPLVYEGHLDEVIWLRSPWSDQFVDGSHEIQVGKVRSTGLIGVISDAQYYIDDKSSSTAEMDDVKSMKLIVLPTLPTISSIDLRKDSWGLDICLDAFTTENPHFNIVCKEFGHELAQVIVDVYSKPLFRSDTSSDSVNNRIREEQRFSKTLSLLYDSYGRQLSSRDEDAIQNLIRFYHSDFGQQLICNFDEFLLKISEDRRRLVERHGQCAALCPKHSSEKDEVDSILMSIENFLGTMRPIRPALITVARSSADGFISEEDADRLQDQVLRMLERVYGTLERDDDFYF